MEMFYNSYRVGEHRGTTLIEIIYTIRGVLMLRMHKQIMHYFIIARVEKYYHEPACRPNY